MNLSPGLQGITEVTNIDVADKIANYLYKKTDDRITRAGESSTEIIKEMDEGNKHEIIAPLDFRGERILLPEIVTKISKFEENEEVSLTLEKGKLKINKF